LGHAVFVADDQDMADDQDLSLAALALR